MRMVFMTIVLIGIASSALFPVAVGSSPPERNTMANLNYEIAFATYLGGSEDEQAREVIPLPDGSVLVGGQTSSSDFPTTHDAVQPEYAGDDPALGDAGLYGGDCFVTRLSPDGRTILASTYFGGSKQERAVYGMALDRQGNVIITSATRSLDLPTTPGCFQPAFGGGQIHWFVAKLSADLGRLLWCTYVGGSAGDTPRGGLTVDEQDNVYVVGNTASHDFPTTPKCFQPHLQGTHATALVELNPDGTDVVLSTLLGGTTPDPSCTIMGVHVDVSGHIFVVGHTQATDFPMTSGALQPKPGGESDCFVAELSSDASRLIYSTYLGGSRSEYAEHGGHLCKDGSILVVGVTASPDFPTTEGAFQRKLQGSDTGFLTKLSTDGKALVFSTLLGGSGSEFYVMPAVDNEGHIYVVGHTSSNDFPVTPGALQATYGGDGDGILAVLSPDASELLYATYLGGRGDDGIRSIALGPGGEVYLVGNTTSKDFPVTSGVVQPTPKGKNNAFVMKLIPR